MAERSTPVVAATQYILICNLSKILIPTYINKFNTKIFYIDLERKFTTVLQYSCGLSQLQQQKSYSHHKSVGYDYQICSLRVASTCYIFIKINICKITRFFVIFNESSSYYKTLQCTMTNVHTQRSHNIKKVSVEM